MYSFLQSFVNEMMDMGGVFGSVNKAEIPDDVEFVYSTQDAMTLWQGKPGNADYSNTIDNNDHHRAALVIKDDKLCFGAEFDCFNVIPAHISYQYCELDYSIHDASRIMAPLDETVKGFNKPYEDGTIAESFALRFTHHIYRSIIHPDIEQFPLMLDMLEIFKAGGCPCAWRGELTPDGYFAGPGHFIVYWPHKEKPRLSDRGCRTLEQIANYNKIHKEAFE